MTRARVPAARSARAGVRAQTAALSAHRGALAARLRDELAVPAVPSGHPALVMLMGLPGVGKTHCARLLAARLGAAHVATDHIRRRLFIAPSYAADENAAVFGVAQALVDDLLGAGHTVVLDATHLRARYRAPAESAARARGVPLLHVLITAADADARARLAARGRERAAGDHSDADVAVYERMRAAGFEAPAGHLELRNGPDLAREVERVAARVESS